MRAARGIYVRPKEVPYLGKVLPGSEEIVKVISQQTGEIIAPHGAEAVRMLQLSTQFPVRSIFYTSGNTRSIKIGKQEIMLKHISPSKLVKPGTIICLVISALGYIGRMHVNAGIIKKVKQRLNPQQFAELIESIWKLEL